jgi:hypothetical protein
MNSVVLQDAIAPVRPSLRALLDVALMEFPEPEQQRRIRDYVRELSLLMSERLDSPDADASRARATSEATAEDVVSLLCRLEDYLESVMVGRAARSIGG